MSQSVGRKDIVSRRYGRVLFLLAHEQKKLDRILKDVQTLSATIHEDANNWKRVIYPTVGQAHQQEIITLLKKSLKLDEITENFLRVVVEKGRLPLLDRILAVFTDNYKRAKGEVDGVLKTSTPVSKPTLDGLIKSLKKKTGLDVSLTTQVDPSILGGATLQIGSLMIDASLSARLNKLRQTMKG